MDALTKQLLDALLAQRLADDCWCPMAIGNPMVTRHTEDCKKAQAAVREAMKREAE